MGRSRTPLLPKTTLSSPSPSVGPSQVPAARRSADRLLLWIGLSLVFVLGGVLGYREIGSPDLGFHLATARWIVEHAALPRTDPLTYSIPDHPYIDLQWLFQLGIYGAYRLGGTAAIVAATTALTLVFAGLLLLRSWRRDGRGAASSILLLALFFLGNQWETRPHLLSWIWGALVLLALEEHARGSRRWLPFLPLVMVAWVNTHSLFVLGLAILATYALWSLRDPRRLDRSLLTWVAVAALACLINPYHFRGLWLPWTQLRDIQDASVFKSPMTGIAEFTSPFGIDEFIWNGHFVLFQPRLCWPIYSALAVLGLIAGRKRLRLPELVLCAGFFYAFWRANKNFGYFVMVSFPAVAAGLDDLGRRLANRFGRGARRDGQASHSWSRAGLGASGAACTALILLSWSGRLYDLAWTGHRRGTGFNESLLPVEACDFITRNRIEGRILNGWDDGGFVAWATGQKVFIYSHGEVVGSEFFEQYIAANQPDGFDAALRQWQPTLAIVPFEDASFWLFRLHQLEDWRMVYADEHTALFLHAAVAPHVPALARPRHGVDYPAFDDSALETSIRTAARAELPGFWHWLRGRSAFPVREMTLSSFYLHTGETDASIGIGLAGVQRTPFLVPDLMLNLGHAFDARHRYEWADLCFDAFLRVDDDAVIAQEIQAARASR